MYATDYDSRHGLLGDSRFAGKMGALRMMDRCRDQVDRSRSEDELHPSGRQENWTFSLCALAKPF